MRCVSIVRSLYFRIFSASFLITFLSPEIATSMNIHATFSLSRIVMSGLLLGIVLSVCTCWFHNMITLPLWLVSTDFGTCSYQCFLSNCTPVYYYYYYYYHHHHHHRLYAVYLNHMPETSHVFRVYNVAISLWLQLMLRVILSPMMNVLYFYMSTYRSMCAVHNMAVFCSSLKSCFPGILLRYFINDIEIVPFACVMTGRTYIIIIIIIFTGAPELHAARRAALLHYHRSGKESLLGAFQASRCGDGRWVKV